MTAVDLDVTADVEQDDGNGYDESAYREERLYDLPDGEVLHA